MRRLTWLAVIGLSTGIAATAPAAQAGYNWSGFYLGGNIGGAWGGFDPKTTTPGDRTGEFDPTSITAFNGAGSQNINPAGITLGFETGYNWHIQLHAHHGPQEQYRPPWRELSFLNIACRRADLV